LSHESGTAARWIVQTLLADSTITAAVGQKVFDTEAPQGALTPYILVEEYFSRDIMGVGIVRVKADLQYIVKYVKQSMSFVEMEPIADRVDFLLHGGSGTPTGGGSILACQRLRTLKYAEPDEGLTFRHLGGIYFVQVQ
jgi:hypothetical protein